MQMYFLSQPLEKQSLCDERLSVAWGNAVRITGERLGAASYFLQGFRSVLVRASKVKAKKVKVKSQVMLKAR